MVQERTNRVRNKIAPQEIFTEAVIQNRNKHYHGTDGTRKPVGTGTCRMVDGVDLLNSIIWIFGAASYTTISGVICSTYRCAKHHELRR
jgi:hypothetical protein